MKKIALTIVLTLALIPVFSTKSYACGTQTMGGKCSVVDDPIEIVEPTTNNFNITEYSDSSARTRTETRDSTGFFEIMWDRVAGWF